MKWIDIILPAAPADPDLTAALAAAADLAAGLPDIQERDGLDAVTVVQRMAETGGRLFQAIQDHDAGAFVPGQAGVAGPLLGDPRHDGLTGYHLVLPQAWLDLPWTWLHNGIEFLFEKHPICWSQRGAGQVGADPGRPWLERLQRARYLVDENGETGLGGTLAQLRGAGRSRPDVLFVAGHSDEAIRRLIYREAELIGAALERTVGGEAIAGFAVPTDAPTPARLREQAVVYQAIHYAGPTSQPVGLADAAGEHWLDRMAAEATAGDEGEFEDTIGHEGKLVGVDQVTAVLDAVADRYEREGAPARVPAGAVAAGGGGTTWLLEDGPVDPEAFGRGPGLPPLVFSNSHLALPEMGARFMAAGANTFVGPVAPLYSRPARRFAGHCYAALADGWSAGAAVWRAGRDCREELGERHPAWLSYGVQGCGLLALQYL